MPKKLIIKKIDSPKAISKVVVIREKLEKPIAWKDYPLPEKWVDYFDGENGKDGYTPKKGLDYFDGKDGKTPTEEELVSLIIPRIPEPIPWKNGKDISEEKVKKLVEKVVGMIEFPTIDIGEDQRGQWIEKDGKKMYIKSVSNIWAWMSTWVVDFIALRDTPSSYVGQAGKFAKVKADETGLEFAAWGGGGGAVDSVNWQTGVVVLDTGDIAEATDANYVSDAQLVVISNTSGTNTGDQTNITGNAGTVTTISGRITAGANVTITGSGTAASPYSIAASGGGGGSPGGSDTQVQFNDGGAFGGDAGMTYSKATNTLKVDTLSTSATDLNIIWGSGGWVLLQWGAGLEDNGVTIAGSAWSASFDTTNLSDARSVSLPDYDGVVALPPDEGTAWYVLTSGWPWVQPTYQAPGGWGGWTTWKVKTANYTAANWEGVLCDSSGSAFTVTLPASPSAGNSVIVKSWSSAATNNITIGRNSQTIVGVAADMTISQPNIEVNFVYSGSTWSI